MDILKNLWYMARHYKLAYALNLAGLTIALATAFLFMTQVQYNATYNHSIKDHDRTLRVEMKGMMMDGGWSCTVCRPFEAIAESLTHVEAVQSTRMNKTTFPVLVGENPFEGIVALGIGKPGLSFFGAEMLYGTCDWAQHPEGAVICESVAQRLFGTSDAVGRTFKLPAAGDGEFSVMGVCKDFADNCFLDNGIYLCYGDQDIDNNQEWSYVIYIRLDDMSNVAEVERMLNKELAAMYGLESAEELEERTGVVFRLTPLDDTYFTGTTPYDKGNRHTTTILTWATIFLLLIALLNYTNFALAQTPKRIRGININKVLGEPLWHIRLRCVGEHIVMALGAFALAMLLLLCVEKSGILTDLMSGSIALASHPDLCALCLLCAFSVGLLAGIYPVLYSTSFAPAFVLRGAFGLSPQGRKLRQAIVLVQFVVALVLTSYVGIMLGQSRHIFNTDYGFDKDEVIFTLLSDEAMHKKDAIRLELMQMAGVEGVAYGGFELGDNDMYMQWGANEGEKRLEFFAIPVDKDYLRVMGIHVAEGRDFTENDKNGAYIVNAAMKRCYPWIELDRPLVADQANNANFPAVHWPVVGITDELKITSMRKDNSVQNAAFFIMGPELADWGDRCRKIFVRTKVGYDKRALKRQVTEHLQGMCPDRQWQFYFLDETLEKTYEEEFRFIRQVELFALISILITLIGVASLTMFETEYRRKEIGIRKVFGSTETQILSLLSRRYLLLLALAFVIATPIALWLGQEWLQGFAERTPIHWWLFPLALLFVAAVTLLTVTIQGWRAATENPINCIKTE